MANRAATIVAALFVLFAFGPAAGQSTIFDSYRTALASRKTPADMEFLYTVTRSGPQRIVTEQHRVYWTASGLERNDTISINGTDLVPPHSRMLHRTEWPYDPGQFEVSSDDYSAVVTGVSVIANRKAYVLKLARSAQADFMVTSLYIDAKTRLPLRQAFKVAGADCQGDGSIDFLPVGIYWLPSFVSVICTGTAQGATGAPVFKEAIRFSGYSFPAAIPPDVFGLSATPAVSPTASAGTDQTP
ncbi:MAG: hypothetical protein JOZ91_12135 [Candidatus Eremiobacteraeota bacterium]|nr:hypothetical protein [Candidatus Eremiobacteraeota bacterium]